MNEVYLERVRQENRRLLTTLFEEKSNNVQATNFVHLIIGTHIYNLIRLMAHFFQVQIQVVYDVVVRFQWPHSRSECQTEGPSERHDSDPNIPLRLIVTHSATQNESCKTMIHMTSPAYIIVAAENTLLISGIQFKKSKSSACEQDDK